MLCKYVEQREVDVQKKRCRVMTTATATAACVDVEESVTGQQQQQQHSILFNCKNYIVRSNIVLPPIVVHRDDDAAMTSEKKKKKNGMHTGGTGTGKHLLHTPPTRALVSTLTPIKNNNSSNNNNYQANNNDTSNNNKSCIERIRKATIIDTDNDSSSSGGGGGAAESKSCPYVEYLQRRSLCLHRSSSRTVVNLFFDGGARPNPAPVGGAGYALFDYEGQCIASNSVRIDWTETYREKLINNHEAEYIGLIHGLKAALRSRSRSSRSRTSHRVVDDNCLVVMGDSELVINQMNGMHEAQKDCETNLILFRLHSHAALLAKQFRHIQFKWISRFRNSVADGLTKLAQLQEEPQHENADWFLPSLTTACILYS